MFSANLLQPQNFCSGTRMARSYKHGTSALQVNQSGFNSAS